MQTGGKQAVSKCWVTVSIIFSTTKHFKHSFKVGISKVSTFQTPDDLTWSKSIVSIQFLLKRQWRHNEALSSKTYTSLAGNSLQRCLVFPGKKIESYHCSQMESLIINIKVLCCSHTFCTSCPDIELEISMLSFRYFSEGLNPFPLLECISYCNKTSPFCTSSTLDHFCIALPHTYLLDI